MQLQGAHVAATNAGLTKRSHLATRAVSKTGAQLAATARAPNTDSSAAAQPWDLRLSLWNALWSAGASILASSAATAGTRVQRLIEPPPKGFPPGPSGDQAVALLQAPLEYLTSVSQRHGRIVGLLLGGERVILVSDPAAAKQVLVAQADIFIKKGTAFFPGSSLTGNGLLVSDGEVWQRQRRLSNPAFRRAAVDTYAAAMVSATSDMLTQEWAQGGTRDVYVDFNQLTLRITLEALFGFSVAPGAKSAAAPARPPLMAADALNYSLSDHSSSSSQAARTSLATTDAEVIVAAVAKAFEFFTRRAGSGLMLPEWLPTLDNLEFAAAVQQLDQVVYGLIRERRQEMAHSLTTGSEQQGTTRTDLLHSLLAARDEDGSGMSDSALRDELMTLLVAGQETSAILLGWATALIAHHPEVQAKAAAEVAEVLKGSTPTAGNSRQLPYVEAVVLEALRLHAPAYMVGRCACRPTILNGYEVDQGTTVLVSPYLMHRDPAVWGPDAGQFRPERWAQWQQSEAGRGQGFMGLLSGLGPNGSYLPFGGGPRNCIGTGFAMMEAILVLAAILQRYSLSPDPSAPAFPTPRPLITLRPERVPLQLQLR